MDDNDISEQQRGWMQLAAAFRHRLAEVMPRADMTTAQAKELAEALRDAYWLEMEAMTMDSRVDKANREFD